MFDNNLNWIWKKDLILGRTEILTDPSPVKYAHILPLILCEVLSRLTYNGSP